MSSGPTQHLAHITPVDPQHAKRVLSLGNLTLNSALILFVQAGWALLLLLWLAIERPNLLNGPSPFFESARYFVLFVALVWAALQVGLAFVYPEWPLNRMLCHRLRKTLDSRGEMLVTPFGPATRVVELVPRERWRKMSFETATDLMVMRVDDEGVWMSGDCFQYELPCDSILGAELISIRPPGWFTKCHMVVVTVRTSDGPVELPVSYRDHWLGMLANNRRQQQAFELTEQITRIATGNQFQSLFVESTDTPQPWSGNPYASPAIG